MDQQDILSGMPQGGVLLKSASHFQNGIQKVEKGDEEQDMNTTQLEYKLQRLRDKSNELSQDLTQRLATSESGQNLVQIGPSLSTLPPDVSSLLSSVEPLAEHMRQYLALNQTEQERLKALQQSIQQAAQRSRQAQECVSLLQSLVAAEQDVVLAAGHKAEGAKHGNNHSLGHGRNAGSNAPDSLQAFDLSRDDGPVHAALERVASLERAAHTTLTLLQQLQTSQKELSTIVKTRAGTFTTGTGSEQAQLVSQLAPRIRQLERSCSKCLLQTLDEMLSSASFAPFHYLAIGHCLRGLALLDKGTDAESVFARVAIMPILRAKVSIGRIDEGGSRGECAGLFSLLDDILHSIATTFGPVLCLAEKLAPSTGIDLLTAGVWIPIATTFIADPAMKMAIFSPGIASILQANFMALHVFLRDLAQRVLVLGDSAPTTDSHDHDVSVLYATTSALSPEAVEAAQVRLYQHPTTLEFCKKWNLPIYYQLRFGEYGTRLNRAVSKVQREGWQAALSDSSGNNNQIGLELPLMQELHDILTTLWSPHVVLRPLTHRFLRGAIQLLKRTLAFCQDGLDKKIQFGKEGQGPNTDANANANANANASTNTNTNTNGSSASHQEAYYWADTPEQVATVAWDLTVLQSQLTHEYYDLVVEAAVPSESSSSSSLLDPSAEEVEELKKAIYDFLLEASQDISPLVEQSWNEVIAQHLIANCLPPLSAVKGVAATYRMTNRPPPTQASPFVAMVLRPLQEFSDLFANRHVNDEWKYVVVRAVSQKYAVAVEELMATVRRTEEALQHRRGRRAAAAASAPNSSSLSDGDKVKLQVYLDVGQFAESTAKLGLQSQNIPGVVKLHELTKDAERFMA